MPSPAQQPAWDWSSAALEDARAAWDAGEYTRVARSLDGIPFARRDERAAAAILRARALLVLGRPAEVIAALERATDALEGPEELLAARMLRGAARARAGDADGGEAELAAVAAEAARSAPVLVPQIAYHRAVAAWAAHRLHDAEAIVAAALPHAAGAARARLLQMRGWIDSRRQRFGPAAAAFRDALEVLHGSGERDAAGEAALLHALASIAAETIDLALGEVVRSAYARAVWSDDVRADQFFTLEYLSWLSLLAGEVERAWDERAHALTITTETGHHAKALVYAAHVAHIVGDRFSGKRQLDLAASLLLRGDQVNLDVERRMSLLSFASFADREHREQAQDAMTLYTRSAPRTTHVLALEGDSRVMGFELYARANLAEIGGDERTAIRTFREAAALFARIGYRFRAALCTFRLYALTGEEDAARAALEHLRDAPRAWLRAMLDDASARATPLAQLTPAERRVLRELCRGKKAREIAAEFGRSFNTINNHTRRIFSVFGVRNRSGLVAACARLGILDDLAGG